MNILDFLLSKDFTEIYFPTIVFSIAVIWYIWNFFIFYYKWNPPESYEVPISAKWYDYNGFIERSKILEQDNLINLDIFLLLNYTNYLQLARAIFFSILLKMFVSLFIVPFLQQNLDDIILDNEIYPYYENIFMESNVLLTLSYNYNEQIIKILMIYDLIKFFYKIYFLKKKNY